MLEGSGGQLPSDGRLYDREMLRPVDLGAKLVATGLGPNATVVLDANEFPVGLTDITAIAVDEAGNQSPPSVRTVTVAHP